MLKGFKTFVVIELKCVILPLTMEIVCLCKPNFIFIIIDNLICNCLHFYLFLFLSLNVIKFCIFLIFCLVFVLNTSTKHKNIF